MAVELGKSCRNILRLNHEQPRTTFRTNDPHNSKCLTKLRRLVVPSQPLSSVILRLFYTYCDCVSTSETVKKWFLQKWGMCSVWRIGNIASGWIPWVSSLRPRRVFESWCRNDEIFFALTLVFLRDHFDLRIWQKAPKGNLRRKR